MSGKKMKNKSKYAEIKQRKQEIVVEAAMKEGHLTRKAICDATGMKAWELSTLFKEAPELYGMYSVRRRTLVDQAADNIQEIIENPEHPQHFAASKYVLSKYKSDLDTILDPSEGEVKIEGGDEGSPIKISFSK